MKYAIGDYWKEVPRWSSKSGQWKLITHAMPENPNSLWVDTFWTRKALLEHAKTAHLTVRRVINIG